MDENPGERFATGLAFADALAAAGALGGCGACAAARSFGGGGSRGGSRGHARFPRKRTSLRTRETKRLRPAGRDSQSSRTPYDRACRHRRGRSPRTVSRSSGIRRGLKSTSLLKLPRSRRRRFRDIGELHAHDEVAAHAVEDSALGLRDHSKRRLARAGFPDVRRRLLAAFGAGVAEGRGRCTRAAGRATAAQFLPRAVVVRSNR